MNRRSQARLALGFGLLAVLLFNIGLNVAVDTTKPQWRDPQFFHRQQTLTRMLDWNARYAPQFKSLVVLGSSRPQMGLSPQHVQEGFGFDPPMVYNCSQTACQPVKMELNLQRLFDAGIVPDALLIEILPAALGHPGSIDTQTPVSQLSLTDLRRLGPYLEDRETLQWRWLAARARPFTTYKVDLLAHAGMADWTSPQYREEFLWADMRPNGWSPYYPANYTDAVRQQKFDAAKQEFGSRFATFAINPHVDQALRAMLKECQQRQIPTALFLMPESAEFRKLYPPSAQELLHGYLEELSQEYNVPVFDARDWIDEESAYMDGHHLLGHAAEAFSRRFGRHCLRSWILEKLQNR